MASFRPRLALALCVLAAACKPETRTQPPAPAPISAPAALAGPGGGEADFRAREAEAKTCMRWLLDTHPAAEPELWTRVRDFALDWIEGAPYVDAAPNPQVLRKVERDRRFFHARYMRAAYLSARTLFRLEHPDASALEAELAAVAGMQRLYAVFRATHPDSRSRVLDKYARLEAKGELEAYVREQIAATRR